MSDELEIVADRVWLGGGRWLAPGAVRVRGSTIVSVGKPAAGVAHGGVRRELSGRALLPGLVNAHAHLELGGLLGRTPRGADFGAWIREVVRLRAATSPAELEEATLRGACAALESGTTTIGDFDATGASERALASASTAEMPRVVLFRELLDARNPARTPGELARLEAPWTESDRLIGAVAPHAPHTVSKELLAACARTAREARRRVASHWAETEEEAAWLEHGGGVFDALLGSSPRAAGLALLRDAGLLGPGLTLVHGNMARPEERELVARSGATLVHCPGTHAFFDRARFPLREWIAAGAKFALGTDSLASNDSLDLRRELARLAAGGEIGAVAALDAATLGGAEALGLAGRVGVIAPGASADLLSVPAGETSERELVERLARGEFESDVIWARGRVVRPLGRPVPRA